MHPSTDRPDLLVVSSELPWPLNTGGHLRTYHLLRALAARCRVRLVTVVERADDPGLAVLEGHGIAVIPAVCGPRHKVREGLRAVRAALQGEPYVMFHRHNRGPLRNALRRALALRSPEVVYLDHLDPLAFRTMLPRVPLVADLHNVYSTLAARVAEERTWPLRVYLQREASLLAAMERRVAATADLLLTVSSQEKAVFEGLGARAVQLVPNGVDCAAFEKFATGREHAEPVVLYLGALSWQPNAAAAEFLARRVMPELRAKHPNARLLVVGRQPGPEVQSLAALPGVEVHADVPEIGPYLERASLLAVPLDSGGGTRLKILEAFAAGLPVVSTAVGAEGIDARHDEHLLLAERDRFAAMLLEAFADPARTTRLATAARALARAQYDWPMVGARACDAVLGLVRPAP